MKRLKTSLEAIHRLPEGVRKLLAAFFFIITVALMFQGWSIFIPSRLERVTDENHSKNIIKPSVESQALGPAEGIAESLKSLDYLLPKIETKDTSGSGLASITTFLASAWKYVYEPLR